MNKYTITIEELNDKDFEIEASDVFEALDIAEEKYKKRELVLDPGVVTFRQIASTGIDPTEWHEF